MVIPAQAVEAAARALVRIVAEQERDDYTLAPPKAGADDEA